MSANQTAKFRLRRPAPPAPGEDDRAEEVRNSTSTELELISTQMLKQILSSGDDGSRSAIQEAACSDVDGVLARDTATGYFEIIDNDELQAILDQRDDLPKFTRPADPTVEPLHDYVDSESLSLVSTQALRRVFSDDDRADEVDPASEINLRGFNPYDCY